MEDKYEAPTWITCPVCGTKVLRKHKEHLSCGDPKCGYAIYKWKRLAERIKEGNPTWWTQFVGESTSHTTN